MQYDKSDNIIKISKDRWIAAQKAELELWKKSANIKFISKIKRFLLYILRGKLEEIADLGSGDDWNFWWQEKFDNYSFLPQEIENALEIGCGPFTNIRLILRKCKIKRIYLNDPLFLRF
ncbi:MAG: hypothetical protein ACUVQP_09945 [Bacteroidales bacterium]